MEGPCVPAADAQAKEVQGVVFGLARAEGETAADDEGLVGQIRGAQGGAGVAIGSEGWIHIFGTLGKIRSFPEIGGPKMIHFSRVFLLNQPVWGTPNLGNPHLGS